MHTPLAVLFSSVICTAISADNGLLRISAGCRSPTCSATLYVNWVKFTVEANMATKLKLNRNTVQLFIVIASYRCYSCLIVNCYIRISYWLTLLLYFISLSTIIDLHTVASYGPRISKIFWLVKFHKLSQNIQELIWMICDC